MVGIYLTELIVNYFATFTMFSRSAGAMNFVGLGT